MSLNLKVEVPYERREGKELSQPDEGDGLTREYQKQNKRPFRTKIFISNNIVH